MCIINEKAKPWQWFDVRLESAAGNYTWQINSGTNKQFIIFPRSTTSFMFSRNSGVITHNGNWWTPYDFSSFTAFDYPLTFWAWLDGNKSPRRYMSGTLSDITVYVDYDNWSAITLPTPTRTNKIFNWWYEDAQCTTPVQLNWNGKYTVGVNKALYADWADYKVTIVSNETAYWNVDISEVNVKNGATIVTEDNTLTIIDAAWKSTIITATVTPSQDDMFSFYGWDVGNCENPITASCTIIAMFNGDKHFVTFDSNRWTFDIFGNMTRPSNLQLVDSGDTVEQPADPELPWYEFLGWFNWDTEWDFNGDTVTGDITLTAKWRYELEYWELDVYTISSTWNKNVFALMDRNVWATTGYNQNYDYQNFDSFGYMYQWWNNYGFNRVEGNGNSYNQVDISNEAVAYDIWHNHLQSKFASKTWITVNTWNDGATTSDNLWWHATNWNEAKQWPCPDWYHVPTKDEFSKALYGWWSNVYWNGTTFWTAEQRYFTKDLLLPLAWTHANWSVEEFRQWICAEYWEAWANSNVLRADDVWFCQDGAADNYHGTFSNTSASFRYNWLSVRCFKNNTGNATLDFSIDWGTNALVSVQKLNWVNTIVSTKDPVKTGMEFGGWFTSSNFEGNTRKVEGSTIPDGNVTLYAKWNCPAGQALNGQGQCVQWVTVTFYDEEGETVLETVSVLSWDPASYPNVDPTKDWGYEFDGWVLSDETPADLTSVTEDMDVYAHFHGGCQEHYHWE